jgi:spermidine synthase
MAVASPSGNASVTTSHRFLPLLVALFVGSGSAALIYEIVWLQMLQLVVGATAVSLGVLLGTFMGGMCIGSLLLPRLISSKAHPLRVYAVLEIGIAICGIIILWAVPYFGEVYGGLGFPHGAMGIFWRAVMAVIFLLPPTILMGATLPAIARWVETTPRGVSWLGFFYGGNIVGAVIGCLVAGFYLLRVHDMAIATYCAMAINAIVAGLAFLFASMAPHESQSTIASSADKSNDRWLEVPSGTWTVYLAICLSGLTALGAEVVWTRVLSLTFGGTVYTFSIILGVFLMGLGIGSSIGAIVARTVDSPRVALGACQLLVAAGIIWAGYMTAASMPFWPIDPSLANKSLASEVSQWYTFQMNMARSVWAILPAACFWGASFPLAIAAAAGPGQEPGRLVGGLYAVNTVGAILGALAFSMWIVPALATPDVADLLKQDTLTLGTQRAQQLLIVIAVISGMIALLPIGRRTANAPESSAAFAWWCVTAAVIGVPAILLASHLPAMPWGLAAEGRFMAARQYENELALDKGIVTEEEIPAWTDRGYAPEPDKYCLYVGEGMNVTVAVTQSNRWGTRSFHGSGKVQASSDPTDMRLQRMLGHIPALVHPNPKTVLVVACGAGVTAGSFIPHPEVEEIVICDIEPLVPNHVTPFFDKQNHNIVGRYVNNKVTDRHFIESGRVKLVYDDGRHYINTLKDKKFDIITSDPIDPWAKGTAALNSEEYYQKCKDHLNEGGVMALWMPIYESDEPTLKSVIATFFKVFPEGILWTNDSGRSGYDAVLFGQTGPTRINITELQARLDREDQKPVKDSMRDVGFNSIAELLGTYGGDARRMAKWSEGAEINTDRNMRLQYLAGLSLNSYKEQELLDGILKYYEFPTDIFSGSEEDIADLKVELAKHGRE